MAPKTKNKQPMAPRAVFVHHGARPGAGPPTPATPPLVGSALGTVRLDRRAATAGLKQDIVPIAPVIGACARAGLSRTVPRGCIRLHYVLKAYLSRCTGRARSRHSRRGTWSSKRSAQSVS